jgi:hypothetical protein
MISLITVYHRRRHEAVDDGQQFQFHYAFSTRRRLTERSRGAESPTSFDGEAATRERPREAAHISRLFHAERFVSSITDEVARLSLAGRASRAGNTPIELMMRVTECRA